MTQLELTSAIASTYDELPYQSRPLYHSRPEVIGAVATLFGMTPAPMETARVLELGCAAGNNLISFAINYPKAKALGIDLSKVQITEGQKTLKELNIKNVELKQLSIANVTRELGEFDYIICHGVFSWVTAEIRERILNIVKENLAPNGVAYINYNVNPGWNMAGSVRDLMLYHSANFATSKEKIFQSRSILGFLVDGLEGSGSPYANFLTNEAKALSNQEDCYIFHEHLNEENKAFYFTEFNNLITDHGLKYVGDVNLPSMYYGNLEEKIASKLATIPNIERTEQYLDFIYNRRFRTSLLCHNNIQLDRNLNPTKLENLFITGYFSTDHQLTLEELSSNDKEVTFYVNADKTAISSSPLVKHALSIIMATNGKPVRFDELADQIHYQLPKIDFVSLKNELGINLLKLILGGYLNVLSAFPQFALNISNKPKVHEFFRYLANNYPVSKWTTNHFSEIVPVDLFNHFLLKYLDGKHTKDQIITKLLEHNKAGELIINIDDKALVDKEAITQYFNQYYDLILQRYLTTRMLLA